MKNQSYKSLAAVAITAMALTGCKLIGDLEYTVTPDPVEMHGDSVKVSITVKIPEKGLHKKASAELTPKLGNGSFKTVYFQGEKATGNGQVIPKKAGGTISYTDVIPYDASMEWADLMVSGLAKKGKKEIEIEPAKIADGTIVTPLWVQNDDKALIGVDNFVRTTEETYSGQLNYAKGKFDVRSAELKQDDIKEFQAWFEDAQVNPKKSPKYITFSAYASPEGETDKNGTLAQDRSKSGQDATVKILEKAKYENTAGEGFYKSNPRGEDWAGFKTAVEKSTMEDKELVLRVLQMYSDPKQREDEIKKMAQTYRELEKDILPPLRRTQMIVTWDKIGWSDSELKELSKTKPDTLTVEELLFTATLYEDLSEKMRMYNLVVQYYPEDWRGPNNVGQVYYMQNDLSNAKTNWEKANGINENPVTLNNLGIVARQNGDRDKASELFNSAISAGSEVKYNLGIIDIQNGDYAEAIGNMGSENTFNKALAQVLNTDYSAALTTVDASPDAESAIGYYLKAIIGARQDNLDMVVNNLKSCFAKDSSLKAKAAKDREFIKFFTNASFQNVTK
jgi:tetratricopeptide (TPR) repeat protein